MARFRAESAVTDRSGIMIVPVGEQLPEHFEFLREQAAAEGVGNMDLLALGWFTGSERFSAPSALFAAYVNGSLAGVGGVTPQADLAEPAMRMRRLYVAPVFRRLGVGRMLAEHMIAHGLRQAGLLTVNARASSVAPRFWRAMGLSPVLAPDHTHERRR